MHKEDSKLAKYKYTRVRTKKLEYLEVPSIAVYLEDVT